MSVVSRCLDLKGPTDLYQKSSAYELPILPAYSEGVRYSYEYGDFFLGASLPSSYDNAIGRLGGSNRVLSDAPGIDSDYAVELAGSYRVDNVFLFLGGYYTDVEAVRFDDDGSIYAINVYLTYERGAWLFAGELNAGNNKQGATDTDLFSSLLMMNYSYSDAASITGRISYESSESDALESRDTKLTFAHNYSFTDNLRLVTEVSVVEGKTDAAGVERDNESLFGAVELHSNRVYRVESIFFSLMDCAPGDFLSHEAINTDNFYYSATNYSAVSSFVS